MANQQPQHLVPDAAPTPLDQLHEQQELTDFAPWGDRRIVTTFGHPQAEYAAIRRGVGLLDLPQRGLIEVTGAERHTFLNNLLTNGLVAPGGKQTLAPRHGCYSFFLNLRGRVVADMNVLEHPDGERTFIDTERRFIDPLLATWDLYLFAEKVEFADGSDRFRQLALHGPGLFDLLTQAADMPVDFPERPEDHPATSHLPVATLSLGGVTCVGWRDDVCGVPGLSLLVPGEKAVQVWSDLVTRFGQTEDDREFGRRPLRPCGWAMFNACRIEAGRSMLGIDFGTAPPSKPGKKAAEAQPDPSEKLAALPAETGPLFEQGVSVTSGCYLGQEVVARMHARKVTAKKIVGFRMQDDALPTAGAPVEVNDQQVGVVTSSTLSPVLSSAPIGLAMLKRPHYETGTKLAIPAEGRSAPAEVVDLPFLP